MEYFEKIKCLACGKESEIWRKDSYQDEDDVWQEEDASGEFVLWEKNYWSLRCICGNTDPLQFKAIGKEVIAGQ